LRTSSAHLGPSDNKIELGMACPIRNPVFNLVKSENTENKATVIMIKGNAKRLMGINICNFKTK
jgi:hypothetical protein